VYGVGLFGYVSNVAFAGTIGFQSLIATHSASVMVQMNILVLVIFQLKGIAVPEKYFHKFM
jgi:hypothetical protein